jgi:hypothetical protein
VLAIAMMGFLNKFMDAIGVELEQSVVNEVASTIGAEWSPGKAGALLDPEAPTQAPPPVDGLRTRLRMIPLLPAVIRYDRRAQRGVPKSWPAVGRFLHDRCGHDFPVLALLRSNRARRAIASMLFANLDPQSTIVGIDVKVHVGAVFAAIVGSEHLAEDVRALLGPGAAGKSTLARRLGRATGLEVIELDKLFWRPGLLPTPPEEWADIQGELVQRRTWIMDGDLGPYDVVGPRLRCADTVIVLDTPRWRCALRALRRSRERADFWRWLWGWRRRYWPRLRAAIATEARQADVVVVRSDRAVGRLLDTAADAGSS